MQCVKPHHCPLKQMSLDDAGLLFLPVCCCNNVNLEFLCGCKIIQSDQLPQNETLSMILTELVHTVHTNDSNWMIPKISLLAALTCNFGSTHQNYLFFHHFHQLCDTISQMQAFILLNTARSHVYTGKNNQFWVSACLILNDEIGREAAPGWLIP